MAFEKAFVRGGRAAGGSGVDPTGIGGALAGFGDQRNYELFIEAGFTPAQAVRIMTANGAKILGVDKRLGNGGDGQAGRPGRAARAISPPTRTVIRNPPSVFKDGVGYDPAKLIASVEGRVGID